MHALSHEVNNSEVMMRNANMHMRARWSHCQVQKLRKFAHYSLIYDASLPMRLQISSHVITLHDGSHFTARFSFIVKKNKLENFSRKERGKISK
jgi:hypothetical protein